MESRTFQRVYCPILFLILAALFFVTMEDYQIISSPPSTLQPASKPRSSDDLSSSNILRNQTYSWQGDQWVPPLGVPRYSQKDMLEAFTSFDTLWIGDSTTRRAYATAHAILTAPVGSMPSEDKLNSPTILDVNKHKLDENSCQTQRENAGDFGSSLWSAASLCRSVGNRSFDFARVNCFKTLKDVARATSELRRYSLVIVGMGVWDATMLSCKLKPSEKDFEYEGLVPPEDILSFVGLPSAQSIGTFLQDWHGESRQPNGVLWRTSGFNALNHSKHYRRLHEFNRRAIDFSKNSNIVAIDWGGAIEPRSYGKNRIVGDTDNHYGVSARLLLVQMATQQIMLVLQNFNKGIQRRH